jgi:hypothetical protein
VARHACSHDVSRLVFRKKDVQSCKPEVPCHDKEVSEHLEELLRDSHVDGGAQVCVIDSDQMLD